MIGSSLGPYRLLDKLGEGGMGEVYRARDTRLGRDVALKVLPIARHADPTSRSRFEREAQALAALNDPHIAAIYDVVDVDDHRAIVMELVAGLTLADVIRRGPITLRVALKYALDISHALAVAHAAGIVHRDLKPGNVVITEAGSAKVLDFGIAKLSADDEGAWERGITEASTRTGVVIGTIGYMSPEQAHGHPVDARSDIFSLGVVMHEMISGSPAFKGETAASLVSALLRDDPPPLRTLAPTTPRGVERCVTRCLEKDPRRRYQSAADLHAVLEDLREDLATEIRPSTESDAAAASFIRRVRRPLALGAVVLALGGVGGFIAASRPQASVARTPTYRPFITEMSVNNPVWSPDGRTLAYTAAINGEAQIFLRGIDATQSTQVTKQAAIGGTAFWSPDSTRIYFSRASDGKLVSVSAGGGEPQPVAMRLPAGTADENSTPAGGITACISPDGSTIVLTRADGAGSRLWIVDTRTNDARPMDPAGMPKPLTNVQALAFSPDGRTLAMLASTTALNEARGAWLISWPAGAARYVFADAPYLAFNSSISWLPDNRRFVMSGHPINGGALRLLMADTGTGRLTPLTGGKDDDSSPSVTADGRRIAFLSYRSGLDVIQFPVDGGPPEPLRATSRSESFPDMSATGVLAYLTDADGAPAVHIDSGGSAAPRPLGDGSGGDRDRVAQPRLIRLSPDTQRLAVESYTAEHLIWIYPTAGGTPVRLDAETTDQHGPSWSPDGNWIAYRRLRSGSWEIVKRPLGGGAVVRLEDAIPGGAPTDWSPTGEWIANPRVDGLHLISTTGAATRVLADVRSAWFRFSRDGSRLLTVGRGKTRQWELTIWDIATSRPLRAAVLPLAASADVQGLALSADETHIILGAGTATSDIWLLEQFEPPSSPWTRWLSW